MHCPNSLNKKIFEHICLAALFPIGLLPMGTAVKAEPIGTHQTASRLTVEITGIKNAEGEVCVSLFSGSAGFPDDADSIVEEQCVAAVETNPDTESPAESPADDNSAGDAASELTAIPKPVMENIIEGLANTASNPEAAAEIPNAEAIATDTSEVVITQAILAITFADIAPGTYAVSVLHDENEDGQLNTGTFGIPVEGFGFSRNPEIRTGAPDFSEAAIVVVGAESTTQVELIYY